MADDISRDSFDPAKPYLGVRLQQGRVWVDADFNEQADIMHRRLKDAIADVMGATGAPVNGGGFAVRADNVLCFDGEHAAFAPPHRDLRFADGPFLVEVRCAPSRASAAAPLGGTLLCAADGRGHVHFSLGIDEGGNVVVHRHGERVLVAPARWHGSHLLRVAFDGLVLGVSIDDEHAGHGHAAVGEAGLIAATFDPDGEAFEPREDRRAARHAVGLLVGMGLVDGERRAGFRGSIESIRIWAGADDSGRPVALWPLDEGVGTIAADTSGRGHHLQLDYGDPAGHPRWHNRSLTVTPGRFYVGGLLCTAARPLALTLPDRVDGEPRTAGARLVYLEAWERIVTAAEDPALRDPALGGVDTAARLRLHHHVRTVTVGPDPLVEADSPEVGRAWRRLVRGRAAPGSMRVRSAQPARLRDACYRVEIHHAGGRLETGDVSRSGCRARARDPNGRHLVLDATNGTWEVGQWCAVADWAAFVVGCSEDGKSIEVSKPVPESFGTKEFWLRPVATFKWSRNHGSEQWPVRRVEARGVVLWPVPGRRVAVGDLVEISDAARRGDGRAGVVSTVAEVLEDGLRLVLADPIPTLGDGRVLTRWQGNALLPVTGSWTTIENGLAVQFGGAPGHGAGEGWTFATREADGSLDWPLDPPAKAEASGPGAPSPTPAWRPPRDGRRHLAALALVRYDDAGVSVRDLRRVFACLGENAPRSSAEPQRVARSDEGARSEPPPRRALVETIRHVGRETQIDDGVIHGRQLAADVAVVPAGASILSERAAPPAGFTFSGQTLRVPNPDPRWHRLPDPSHALDGCAALLETPSGWLAFVPEGCVWHLGRGEERWRAVAEMPARLRDFAAAARGDAVHVVGGREGEGSPVPAHWVLQGDQWTRRASLRVARAGHVLQVLAGQLLAVGGLRTALSWRTRERLAKVGLVGGRGEHSTASVEVYDDEGDRWIAARSLPVAVAHAAAVVHDGRLHVLGGRKVPRLGRARATCDHVELGAPAGSWTRRRPLPRARARAAAALLGDDVYVLGGEDDAGLLVEVDSYVAAHDRWHARPSLPSARQGATAAAWLGALVCAGGRGRDDEPEPALACTLETTFFVHRRTGGEDRAAGHSARPPALPSAPPSNASSKADALQDASGPAPSGSAPADPAPRAGTSAASPGASPPAETSPGSPPSAPSAASPPTAPSPAPATPSSLSGVVASHPAPVSSAKKPPSIPLPKAISKPALGLEATLSSWAKKAAQTLTVLALALVAGVIGAGRGPAIVDGARRQLIVWLTPRGDTKKTAQGSFRSHAIVPPTTLAPSTPSGDSSGSIVDAGATGELNLGDPSAPYARGVDVSLYQGPVPWDELAQNGITYAFTRASQGTTYRDPRFADNWAAMQTRGILRGAYHVWEPDEEPAAQATFFAGIVGKKSDLPPVIDVELVSHTKKCPDLLADIQTFAQTVEQQLGQVVAIYSYGGYWSTYLTCAADANAAAVTRNLALRPLWVADYENTSAPGVFGGHSNWSFWQYTSHGNDDRTPMDLDRFAGAPQDLRRWLSQRLRPPVGDTE